MENDSEKLIARVENRLQLVLTISIFFPTILYSFFKFVGEQEQSSDSIFLKASTIIVAYLMSYLLFVFCKNWTDSRAMKFLNGLLLLGIGTFIIPVMFASSGRDTITFPYNYLLLGSMYLQSITAGIIFALLSVICLFQFVNYLIEKFGKHS